MNIIFTHKIIKLAGKNSLNNLDKVITRINFNLKGEISTPIVYEITKEFSVFLELPIQDNFKTNYRSTILNVIAVPNKTFPRIVLFFISFQDQLINSC